MSFQPDRMKKLLEQDRFLSSAYDDVREHFPNDEEALHYLFQQYVKSEPIFQNAYNHLID
ncbi:hypothetical protein [Halalkalibacter nanhaiisediminis]|uniref:Uncharacterized protein n=1 Tax=Halalkalibacter nanhaiisediminis TaxID=688079 RepID=A0A562QKG4_9BACI|nr:hypothetical protein [Halalkalibacter nanhaiisediminis]TWI57163.1 hypothetical protein IQ10_01869 [Halalkalibacter nanhaiisediminis]